MQKLLIFLSLFTIGCATQRKAKTPIQTIENQLKNSKTLANGHTGFVLLDPETGRKIVASNEQKYFTPASNTKILTLAASLQFLPDTLPGAEFFKQKNDEGATVLHFRGTGDPTFLHPDFEAWQPVFQFLKNSPDKLLLVEEPSAEPRFGRGWSWDDYHFQYMTEKTAFPIFGNCIELHGTGGGEFHVQPPSFRDKFFYPVMAKNVEAVERLEHENLWGMNQPPKLGEVQRLPIFRPAANELLADTLKKTVDRAKPEPNENPAWQLIRSTPLDTVLRRMMLPSDNFLAEQLVLLCARQRFGKLESEPILKFMQDSVWQSLPQKLKWVDGSGLSRYNLNTPENLATLLRELWKKYPRGRLFSLFPAGGVSGTISKNYSGVGGKPYVFAKSGSMSGVYCLSGFVVCGSGRVLVFSFMHNSFLGSNLPVRADLQFILEAVRDGF